MDKLSACYEFGPFKLEIRERRLILQSASEKVVNLTAMEFKLVQALVMEALHNYGSPLESEALSRRIGGASTVSLKMHYSNLKRKMAPDSKDLFLIGGEYGIKVPVRRCLPIQSPLIRPPETNGIDPERPPFVGPQPFSRERVREFFGRTAECDELVHVLQKSGGPKIVVIHSRSGAGKTSLINAALCPELAACGYDVLPAARLGVITHIPTEGQNPYTWAAIDSMESNLGSEDSSRIHSWKSYLGTHKDPDRPRLLVIDQLEELLTMRLGRPSARREFFVELLEAISAYPLLRVVLAIREEFFLQVQRLAKELEPYWLLFPLEPLQLASAVEAITEPARSIGVVFDRDVANALVNELAHIRYTDIQGRIIDEPGEVVEPLQLQVVCQILWKRLPARIRNVSWDEIKHAIPLNPTDSAGVLDIQHAIKPFVSSALADFCGDVFREVAEEMNFSFELLVLGCERFVSKTRTRSFVPSQARHTGALPTRIVERLAKKHLLRVEHRNGCHWYELAHDTLIEPILGLAQQIDVNSLQQLWWAKMRIAAAPHAAVERIDEADLIRRFGRSMINNRGVPMRAPVSSLGEIPAWAIEATSESGLLKQSEDQGEVYCEVSHLHLATALYQIQQSLTGNPGPLYDVVRILFSSVISIIVAIIAVSTTRAFLQGFHSTLTQATGDGLVNGGFQGIMGAIDWGIFISSGLASWWYIKERSIPRRTRYQSFIATFFGGLAGMAGGIAVTLNLLYAQSRNSLLEAGWILQPNRDPITAFTDTGFGYSMIIMGIGLGAATGLSVIRILGSSQWDELVRLRSKDKTLKETVYALRGVLMHTLRQSYWIILPIMAIAAVLDYLMFSVFSNRPALHRIAGEAFTIAAGAFGLTGGLLFGIFALRAGFAIPAPEERIGRIPGDF